MEATTVDKCLAVCQALAMSNKEFTFSLSVGKDNFNFKNKELVKSFCVKKKKSPSQMRREENRREKKREKAREDTEKVPEKVISAFNCD
jgi:hypothetical protein